jgi:hypothetical protein
MLLLDKHISLFPSSNLNIQQTQELVVIAFANDKHFELVQHTLEGTQRDIRQKGESHTQCHLHHWWDGNYQLKHIIMLVLTSSSM